jgi:hypothetical protein
MMIIDKKQIHRGSSMLLASDILPPFVAALRAGKDPVSFYLRERLSPATQDLLRPWSAAARPSKALLNGLRKDLNPCLREGIYEPSRFAGVTLSPATRRLLKLEPKHGVDLIDLSRCLLEDAYPNGIAHRMGFPDLKRHYAARMANLIQRKTQLALRSHRRVGWLMDAFQGGPEKVMRALLDQGLIDIDHPSHSRLFEKFDFSGPMFKVFTEEEKTTLIDWIESLRADGAAVTRPEPAAVAEPVNATLEWLSRRTTEAAHEGRHRIAGAEPDGSGVAPSPAAEEEQPFGNKRGRIGMGSVH